MSSSTKRKGGRSKQEHSRGKAEAGPGGKSVKNKARNQVYMTFPGPGGAAALAAMTSSGGKKASKPGHDRSSSKDASAKKLSRSKERRRARRKVSKMLSVSTQVYSAKDKGGKSAPKYIVPSQFKSLSLTVGKPEPHTTPATNHNNVESSSNTTKKLSKSQGKSRKSKARSSKQRSAYSISRDSPSYLKPTHSSTARSNVTPMMRMMPVHKVPNSPTVIKKKKKKSSQKRIAVSPQPALPVKSVESIGMFFLSDSETYTDDGDREHTGDVMSPEQINAMRTEQFEYWMNQVKTPAGGDSDGDELFGVEFDYDTTNKHHGPHPNPRAAVRSASRQHLTPKSFGQSPDIDISSEYRFSPCRDFRTPPIPRAIAPVADVAHSPSQNLTHKRPEIRRIAWGVGGNTTLPVPDMDLDLSKLVISNQVKERKEPAAMVPTAVLVMRDIEHTEDEEVHSPSSPLPFSRQISGLRLREMKLDDTQHHALEDEFASTGGMQTPVIVPKLNLSGFHRVRSDEDLLVSTPKISGRGSEIGQTGSAFQQLSARSNQSSQVSSARSNFSVTSETSYSLNSGPNSTRRYNSNASDIPTAPA